MVENHGDLLIQFQKSMSEYFPSIIIKNKIVQLSNRQ